MKRLLTFLLLPFLAMAQSITGPFPGIPGAQSEIFNSATTATCAFDRNVSAGDLLIVSMNWETGTVVTSVADTVGSSYTQELLNTANTVRVGIWAGYANASGANTVTVTVTSGAFENITCAEFDPSWLLTLDSTCSGACSAAFSGTPSTVTTPVATTGQNHDLLYAHIGGFASAGIFAMTTAGWQSTGAINGHDSGAAAYSIAGLAGTYSTTFSNATNSQGAVAIIALKSKALNITSDATAPGGALTYSYNWTLQAQGGVGALTWSITSGALQTGLSLNTSTGAITGTPTASSTNSITFQVTDGTNTASKTISLTVGATLNTISVAQSKNTVAAGGQASLTFTSDVTSGQAVTAVYGYSATKSQLGYCTDTLGTPLRRIGIGTLHSGSVWSLIEVAAGVAPSTGADTVTCSGTGVTTNTYSISALNNVTYIAADNALFTSGTTSSPAIVTSGSLTPLVPNEWLYAIGSSFTGIGTMTAQSPLTDIGPDLAMDAAYKLSTTVTGYTASFAEASNTSGIWGIEWLGLRPSAGVVTPAGRRRGQVIQ